MSPFGSLLVTTLKQHFGLSAARDKYLRRKEALWQPLLALFILVTAVAPMMWLYIRLLNSTYNISLQLNQPGLVLLLGFLMVQTVILFFGIFYLISVFYFSHDLEMLVPLPLKPESLMGAKLAVIIISEYVTTLPIVVPPLIIFGLRQDVSAAYWPLAVLITALLPMLPLALAGILVMLLMRFTRLSRHPDTVRVISSVVLFGVIMVLQFKLTSFSSGAADPAELTRMLASGPNSLLGIIGQKFPPSLWGALALADTGGAALRYLLQFLATTAASLGILWFLAKRSFYEGLLVSTSPHASSRKRHKRTQLQRRPVWAALALREWMLVIRHPIFAMTAAQALILPPMMLGIGIFSGNSLVSLRTFATNPALQVWITLGLAAFVAIDPVLSAISATCISREGNLFWISRLIPVPAHIQLLSKLIFCISAAAIAGVLTVLMLLWLGVPATTAFLGLGLGLLYAVPANALALSLDVLWPRLEWSNPQQAMKSNFNNILALVPVGLITYLEVRFVMWGNEAGWAPTSLLWAVAAIALVLGALFVRVLFRLGPALYTPHVAASGGKGHAFAPAGLHKNGRAVFTAIVLVIAAFFIGREIFTGMNLEYEFGADAVQFAGDTIPYAEITNVEYLPTIPALSNRFGTAIGNYASGTFTVAGVGRGQVVAKDVTQPGLLIRTSETFYIITPPDAAARYEEVKARIGGEVRAP